MNKIWIENLTFNDGTKIEFGANDITVIVGPNNAGKSACLRESAQLMDSSNKKGKVIAELSIGQSGNAESLIEYLNSISEKHQTSNPLPYYKGSDFNIYEGNAIHQWAIVKQNGLSELSHIFVKNITTADRLQAANPTKNINLLKDQPSHPIHYLQKKDSLEKRFSAYFKQAFGTDLIVHRNAGSEVPLYVGDRPIPKEGEDRLSEGYLQALESLDLLHEQGDGMRAFVGVLLNAFVSRESVLFVDEPEAFLHPPQAKLLGTMLARDLPSQRQLFLATHSGDFLKGILDSNSQNLKIIRIRRNGIKNKVSLLNSDDIKAIWNDSLLRHSNVLDGLFHSKVVICESDSDCRFYSAVLGALYSDKDIAAPDVMFIHCGGKHRIPMVVKALKKLDTPLAVVSDFDVLNDIKPLKQIVEELGGNWSEIEADWKLVKTSIDNKRPELEAEEVKRAVSDVLARVNDRIFPPSATKEIGDIIKKASAWAHAKTVGKPFIPSGAPTLAFDRLQLALSNLGLLVVEVGEVEGFVRSAGNHGPKWVNEVLSKDLKADPELEGARRFVEIML